MLNFKILPLNYNVALNYLLLIFFFFFGFKEYNNYYALLLCEVDKPNS